MLKCDSSSLLVIEECSSVSLQTVLRPSAVAGFLRPMQFQKIRFLGGKLGASIAAEYDAAIVGDLW